MIKYGMEEKRGVISGGTSGIGLAVARNLVREGAFVYLVGRDAEKGQKAVAELQGEAGETVYIQADLSTLDGCRKVAETVAQDGKKLDFLVNSAGVYQEKPLQDITEADYASLMDGNVKSTLFLTQQLLPHFADEGPSIVNIASDAALEGNYGCSLYAAAKGAVVAVTRALALDFAPWIRVNCVCPGDVDTPLVQKQLEEGGYSLESMASVYPLGRIGKPEEVAHVICSILSPLNGFMTGSIVSVDGGLTAK